MIIIVESLMPKVSKRASYNPNRGFTDAYLLSRPFEKNNTESHGFSIQDGTHQVAGLVSEDGLSWRCKDKTCVGDRVEIVLPIAICDYAVVVWLNSRSV